MEEKQNEENGCVGSQQAGLPTVSCATSEKEVKSFKFVLKQDSLTEEGEFSGHASIFNNIDLDDDIILPGAFAKTLQSGREIVVLSQHDSRKPIGKIIEAREDDVGLFVKGKLAIGATEADNTRVLMKAGVLKNFSIGFVIKDAHRDEDKDLRIIREIDLFEVSIVTFASNPKAGIADVKTPSRFQSGLPVAPRSRAWNGPAAVGRIKTFTGSTDGPSDTYLKGFLWWDVPNRDNFGAYKLPFVDVIGGKLTIVPRGLSAAKAALAGARGGVDIPGADVPGVRRLIQRYENRITDVLGDADSDDGKNLEEILTLKEAEDLLKDFGFSKKRATQFVSLIKRLGLSDSGTDDEADARSDSVGDDAITKKLDEINSRLRTHSINSKIKDIKKCLKIK